jgi:hypothetical protein
MAAAPVFAGNQVRLTGNLALDFVERPSVQQVLQSFNNKDQIFFLGFGWEVVFDRVGLGGMYDTNFYKDVEANWWLDWLTEPVYLSYHLFRGGAFIDPFITVGLGCAGRVFLGGIPPLGKDGLYLSIFPSVGAGLALDFDGFLLSARLSYVPTMTSPPVTDIDNYPLKKFYVTLSAGVALGSHH